MYIKSDNLKFAARELARKVRMSEEMEDREYRARTNGKTEYADKLNARIALNRAESAAQIEILNRLGLMARFVINADGYTERVDIVDKF